MKVYKNTLALFLFFLLAPSMARGGRGGGRSRGGGGSHVGGYTSSSRGKSGLRNAAVIASLSRPRPTQRSCHRSNAHSTVSLACQSSNATELEDKIDFMVQQEDGLCVSVGYKQNVTDTNTTQNGQFGICVDSLVEYRKTTAFKIEEGEAYDWENDQVLQTLNLTEWTTFSNVTTTEDEVSFSASTPNDLVTLTFTMRPSGARGQLTPNKMKLDVRITNFPWMVDDSYVALVSHVQSQLDVAMNDAPKQDDLPKAKKPKNVTVSFEPVTDSIGYSISGEFTWADSALVQPFALETFDEATANTIPVVASSPSATDTLLNGSQIHCLFLCRRHGPFGK